MDDPPSFCDEPAYLMTNDTLKKLYEGASKLGRYDLDETEYLTGKSDWANSDNETK